MGFYAVDAQSGAVRWKQPLLKVTARAAVTNDIVVVADGANLLQCLQVADGQTRWKYQAAEPFTGQPLLLDINHDSVVDVVAFSDSGILYALDGRNGERLWEFTVSTKRSRTGISPSQPTSMATAFRRG